MTLIVIIQCYFLQRFSMTKKNSNNRTQYRIMYELMLVDIVNGVCLEQIYSFPSKNNVEINVYVNC